MRRLLRSAAALALCLGALAPAVRAQVVLATDYGVVADPAVDNAPAIQRAVDDAVRSRVPGQIATVDFPCGVIGYEGVITVRPDSLRLRGCGGTVLTRDVTRPGSPTGGGEVYYPVRRVTDVLGDDAPVTILRVRDAALARGPTRITLDPGYRSRRRASGPRRLHRFWVEDLVLDGNLGTGFDAGSNLAVIRSTPMPQRKARYQDSPTHTGLNAGKYQGVDTCLDGPRRLRRPDGATRMAPGTEVGLLVSLTRVEISGFAATGVLGERCNRWAYDTVRLADAPYNHVAYKADGGGNRRPDGELRDRGPGGAYRDWGGATDLTLAGSSWTETVAQFGQYTTRLVYEGFRTNPLRDNGDGLINVRTGTAVVSCLRVRSRFSASRQARYGTPGVFAIQQPNRAAGYLWEDGRLPGDCEPPPDKIVLPTDGAGSG